MAITEQGDPAFITRPMEPGDAEQVVLLIQQLGYDRSVPSVLSWIQGLAADNGRQVAYVACLGGRVVGWIEVSIARHLQSAPFALIGGLVVEDGHRGSGIGRELCRQAELWSWQNDASTLRVTSRTTREGAHRFYRSNGYRELKTSLVFEKSRPAGEDGSR